MQTPPRTDPPYVPIRQSAWPVRKTPRSWFVAGLVIGSRLGKILGAREEGRS